MEPSKRASEPPSPKTPEEKAPQSHKRLVFADPAAFRYLEEDPSTTVLERRRRLQGYELYFVEQWICSRVHPTFLIATYTGLEQHSILVGVLSVPTDEHQWSPRLRVYFKALEKFHAREKDTPLGTLTVTNLSSFPSALNVILIPDGDARTHREEFFVNENLKRMGCAGRAGMNLLPPVAATQAKFMQLYHTSDRVPLQNAVLELVKLCQVALVLFGKLAPEYCDGLLCDVTERGINDWWDDIGGLLFNTDPNDGILGPTTVAAILGVLIGARNRLHAFGAPVAKDVFDLVATKRGIAYFQKSQKLERTRRLDHRTIDRLHRATAKAASGEAWNMHRAVKSTVAELSGRGGEMVRDMVGREKIGIAEIETLNIETFVDLLTGERSRWLWHGKPRKNAGSDAYNNISKDQEQLFTQKEDGDYVWTSLRRDSVVDSHRMLGRSNHVESQRGAADIDGPETKDVRRRNVIGRVKGKVKGAVGLRGHYQRLSREDNLTSHNDSSRVDSNRSSLEQGPEDSTPSSSSKFGTESLKSLPQSRRPSVLPEKVKILRRQYDSYKANLNTETDSDGRTSIDSDAQGPFTDQKSPVSPLPDDTAELQNVNFPKLSPRTRNTASKSFLRNSQIPLSLRRTQSYSDDPAQRIKEHHTYRWPRRLSYDIACEALMGLNEATDGINEEILHDAVAALANERKLFTDAQAMAARLQILQSREATFIEDKIKEVGRLDEAATRNQEQIDELYNEKLEEHNQLHDASNDLIDDERTQLMDMLKDLDTLGAKFEYELSALQSKVEDMENGVAEFERQVVQIEGRADSVERDQPVSWYWWFLGLFIHWVQSEK